jgi:hypothetical protein
MSAQSTTTRGRSLRRLAGILAASALAASVLGGTVQAANSRDLFIGSNLVDASGAIIDLVNNDTRAAGPDGLPDNAGILLPTTVSAGYTTAVPVQVKSTDNQTIANVTATFPAGGVSLAPSLSIKSVEGTDKGSCSIVTENGRGTGATCDFGNLSANGLRSVYLVVETTSATSAQDIFSASVTTNNENGSNLQTFVATSGAFAVQAASDNGLSTFVPPGQAAKPFSTVGVAPGNALQTKIEFKQSAGGNFVAIAENDASGTTFAYTCPAGLECQAAETTISVQEGFTGVHTIFGASPYLKVTLTALVPKSFNVNKAFVAHYGASPTTPDWLMVWSDKSTRCGNNIAAAIAANGRCFLDASTSKTGGAQTLVLQVVLTTNGGMRY